MEYDRVAVAVDRNGRHLAKLVTLVGPVLDGAGLRRAVQVRRVDGFERFGLKFKGLHIYEQYFIKHNIVPINHEY